MSEKWYNNDWFLPILASLAFVMAAAANYYIHGGHIQW
jgi:hypothetical protein